MSRLLVTGAGSIGALAMALIGAAASKSDAQPQQKGLTAASVNLRCTRYHEGLDIMIFPESDDAHDLNNDGQNDTYIRCMDGTTYALFTGREDAGYQLVN